MPSIIDESMVKGDIIIESKVFPCNLKSVRAKDGVIGNCVIRKLSGIPFFLSAEMESDLTSSGKRPGSEFVGIGGGVVSSSVSKIIVIN